MRFLQLGASLYVPANRPDLAEIGNGRKIPGLRSVIFCTEDALLEPDVPHALANLDRTLRELEPCPLLRFIRPRNAQVLRALLRMDGINRMTGFVLPKVTEENLDDYFAAFQATDRFEVMVTLETEAAFDARKMIALRDLLLQDRYCRRILSLRIGGNDLLNTLGLRRPRGRTVYATPLGVVIAQLVTIFRPAGFNLSAPVFDYLDNDAVLRREVRSDLSHGLFGKAAIHPRQVPVIERQYRVARSELEMAQTTLDHAAPGVFQLHGAMCEPATHRAWALQICERARIYGIREPRTYRPLANPTLEFPRSGTEG